MSEKIDTTKFAGHTAGPWHVGRDLIKRLDAHGNPCRHIVEFCWPDKEQQAAADHRLIAAAPDLLAAYTELSRENAELRDMNRSLRRDNEDMSAIVFKLRTQVAALQRAVEWKNNALMAIAALGGNAQTIEAIGAVIAYTGQPLAPTDPNHVEDA